MVFITFGITAAYAQCEPDINGCPDPENNGEICPDTLSPAILNQPYNEVITILVPDTNQGVQIHHITLVDVGNMPTGMTWQSNAVNNEFMAGEYYCILMEGTPTVSDTFYLEITVDIYIDFFGNIVYAGQQVDDTSVYMEVVDPSGIGDPWQVGHGITNRPNPFSGLTEISYFSDHPGRATFEIYSLTGQMVSLRELYSEKGENVIRFAANSLTPGVYYYRLKTDRYTAGNKMMISR